MKTPNAAETSSDAAIQPKKHPAFRAVSKSKPISRLSFTHSKAGILTNEFASRLDHGRQWSDVVWLDNDWSISYSKNFSSCIGIFATTLWNSCQQVRGDVSLRIYTKFAGGITTLHQATQKNTRTPPRSKTYMFWLSTVKLMASQYLTDILTLSIFQKRYEKKRTTKHTWDTHPSITTSVPQHKVAMPPRQRSFWAWHWFCVVSLDWCSKRWQTNSVLLPDETIYQNESNMQGKQLERIQLWGALLLHKVNQKNIFWVQRFAYVAHHVVLLTVWPDRRYVHRRK